MKEKYQPDDYDLDKLRGVLREQIKSPSTAIINSEHSFVARKLFDMKAFSLSLLYWHYITCGRKPGTFPDDIVEMIGELDKIDGKSNTIPQWGTYGT